MSLAVYIHIPYCLQRCRYCDFTTFEFQQIMPPGEYVELVKEEIRRRHPFVPGRDLTSIYFGGGTPSLLEAELIVAILDELANAGFRKRDDTEITIEINPATLTPAKLDLYAAAGINRYSVGAQTFSDPLLTLCGRKHSADDTRKTLDQLVERKLNYSFDLLFALPGQTLADLTADLREVVHYGPPHLSAYCLTVPESHPMHQGRPLEDVQVTMFDEIESALRAAGILKYEISNFARPGFESRHNLTYWSDRTYWGLGLSAHSYFADRNWGVRFWNPKSLDEYRDQVLASRLDKHFLKIGLPLSQQEHLGPHEALTDFSHMFLRKSAGLPLTALRNKFGPEAFDLIYSRLESLATDDLVQLFPETARLSPRGELLSNLVFAKLFVSAADWMSLSGSRALPQAIP
jgi:oxygen-independent coproporphyrinogen III oxidase